MDPLRDFVLTLIKILLAITAEIVADFRDMLMAFYGIRVAWTLKCPSRWYVYDSFLRSPFFRPASSDFDLCLELATDPREEGRSGFNLSIPSSPLIWLKYIYISGYFLIK